MNVERERRRSARRPPPPPPLSLSCSARQRFHRNRFVIVPPPLIESVTGASHIPWQRRYSKQSPDAVTLMTAASALYDERTRTLSTIRHSSTSGSLDFRFLSTSKTRFFYRSARGRGGGRGGGPAPATSGDEIGTYLSRDK